MVEEEKERGGRILGWGKARLLKEGEGVEGVIRGGEKTTVVVRWNLRGEASSRRGGGWEGMLA